MYIESAQYPEQFLSKDFICLQLHAMAELMALFFSKDITIENCCKELNIKDFKELLALTNYFILINNFSEQKDENHDLTKNDDYIKDDLDVFKFEYIQVIEGNKNPKSIIKEVRDAFEHKSFYIHKYGKVYVDNKRTGFKAIIDTSFLTGSFFYYYNANNMNNYLLDDRNIDYKAPIEKTIDNLKIYRIIAKRKNEERNMYGLARLDLKTLTKNLSFNDDYKYIEVKLNLEEKHALKDFFQERKFNKENLYIGLSIIKSSGPALSNIINQFVFLNFLKLSNKDIRSVVKKYLNSLKDKDITDRRNKNLLKVLFNKNKFCENYFKLLFIKYAICNLDYEMSEEDIHIRNCLAHSKYTWLNSEEILMKDHPNGINNESNITFIKKYNVIDLYNKAKELWIYTPKEQSKKM